MFRNAYDSTSNQLVFDGSLFQEEEGVFLSTYMNTIRGFPSHFTIKKHT